MQNLSLLKLERTHDSLLAYLCMRFLSIKMLSCLLTVKSFVVIAFLVHVLSTLNNLTIVFFAGDMFELGVENGRYYSLNVPLKDGIDDQGMT